MLLLMLVTVLLLRLLQLPEVCIEHASEDATLATFHHARCRSRCVHVLVAPEKQATQMESAWHSSSQDIWQQTQTEH